MKDKIVRLDFASYGMLSLLECDEHCQMATVWMELGKKKMTWLGLGKGEKNTLG